MTLIDLPPAPPKHPAKFTDTILGVLNTIVAAEAERQGHPLRVLDPMAGVGTIHRLDRRLISVSVGVELEHEWATQHPCTVIGDATALPMKWTRSFDAVMTSPPYANRMADHHNARDDSRRMTYKHQLGRDLSAGSGAGLQWGDAYRDFGRAVIAEMVRVTKPGGIVVVNVSNHIRGGREQLVSEWWLGAMLKAGLRWELTVEVPTPRMRFGENAGARVECEWVFVTRKPEPVSA